MIPGDKFYEYFDAAFTRAGFGARHRLAAWDKADFSNPLTAEIVDIIKTRPDCWFALCGKSGSGKTYLMTLLAQARIAEGKNVLYYTAFDLVSKINLGPIESRLERIEVVKEADTLIIDELGRASKTDAARGVMFEIINYRYDNYKQTCIISNMPYNELFGNREQFFDEAFQRRFETAGVIKNFDFVHKG